MEGRMRLRVGQEAGADLVGTDQRVLQTAVDHAGELGGGVVEVGPGVYTMHDALHLRSGVSVLGAGAETILRKSPGVQSPLLTDADYGEEAITLLDGTGFDPGCGVAIWDDATEGFGHTVAHILEELPITAPDAHGLRDGHGSGGWDALTSLTAPVGRPRSVRVSVPMQNDYEIKRGAQAATLHPIVSGDGVANVQLTALTVEGPGVAEPVLNGCRGGGIYLYRCQQVVIEDCTVQGYHGDGISFQLSNDVRIERCLCRGNAGLGIHPGSGSQRPVVLDCQCVGNGQIGLYLCWRVKGGRFARLLLQENGRDGLSIGHKDTDNEFADLICERNRRYGIHFREEPGALAGHRNRFLRTRVIDNGRGGLCIEGATKGLRFTDLELAQTGAGPEGSAAIRLGPAAEEPILDGVRLFGYATLGLEPSVK
jgi:parallel beta-helix repeat protein